MSILSEKWATYFSENHDQAIEQIQATYPEERSLYVDLLQLYDFDEDFLQALLSNPTQGFAAGESILQNVTGIQRPVHIRVKNNPQQRAVAGVRARHVGDLLTVRGIVNTVDPVRASTVSAAYECPVCNTSVTLSQTGLEMATPKRCDSCGWDREFTTSPEDSQFVDFQKVTLVSPEDEDNGFNTELPAYLDDDIVGTVSRGGRHSLTGVVRVYQESEMNEFLVYLDVRSVSDTEQVSDPEGIDSILDSRWRHRG